MASTILPSAFPDLAKPVKHTLRLSPGTLGDRRPEHRYFTARYNHKPSQVGPRRSTKIRQQLENKDGDTFGLTIEDTTEDEKSCVEYAGHKADNDNESASYILLYDQNSEAFTLESIEGDYSFNLIATPWEKDRSKLRDEYKQILRADVQGHSGASPKHAHSGTDDEDDSSGVLGDEPDKDKPFDFRRFLNAPPSPVVTASRVVSTSNTPLRLASSPARPNSVLGKASPLMRPKASPLMKAKKHQRNISTSSLGPGRASQTVDKGLEKKETEVSLAKKKKDVKQAIPKVQLERKASIRPGDEVSDTKTDVQSANDDNDDLDDDFLIIEGEDDEADARVRTPVFKGTPAGGAPVSLSQLATSNSPAGFDQYQEDSEMEDEAGDEDEDEVTTEGHGRDQREDDNLEDDANGDVQSISLGTPAHHNHEHTPGNEQAGAEATTPRQQQDEDEDLMAIEAELMSGLEFDDDEGASPVVADRYRVIPPSSLRQVQAEESESEEE